MSKCIAIGCGGAGNVLLNALATETKLFDNPKEQNFYYNTTSADLLASFVGKKLILDADGTGRDKKVGASIVKTNIQGILDNIDAFYTKNLKDSKGEIIQLMIITSLGGGTGSSVTPVILDFLEEIKTPKVKISVVAIMSSNKEGVATIPNCIKTFEELYNNYCLNGIIDNLIVFDNEKYEKDYGFNTYDYSAINSVIVSQLYRIFSEEINPKSNSGGMQALDLNEKRRVMYWGKGVADYVRIDLDKSSIKEELSIESSITVTNYKPSTAKAVSMKICIAESRENTDEATIEYLNYAIEKVKRTYKNAFFVFGFEFNSANTEGFVSIELYINGLEFLKKFESNVKKATKEVSKLKEKNKEFKLVGDLDF